MGGIERETAVILVLKHSTRDLMVLSTRALYLEVAGITTLSFWLTKSAAIIKDGHYSRAALIHFSELTYSTCTVY